MIAYIALVSALEQTHGCARMRFYLTILLYVHRSEVAY